MAHILMQVLFLLDVAADTGVWVSKIVPATSTIRYFHTIVFKTFPNKLFNYAKCLPSFDWD